MGFLQHVITVAPDFTIFLTFLIRCLKGVLSDTPSETVVSPVCGSEDAEMVWQEFYDDAATFRMVLQSAESAASLFITPYEALLPPQEARKSPYVQGSVQVIGTDASQYVGGGANVTLGEKWRLFLPYHVRRDILASMTGADLGPFQYTIGAAELGCAVLNELMYVNGMFDITEAGIDNAGSYAQLGKFRAKPLVAKHMVRIVAILRAIYNLL